MNLLLALCGLTIVSPPQPVTPPPADGTGAFVYRPERIRVGTLYHYRKSNRDGSHPDDVLVYVASKTRLDVLKLEKGVNTGVNVKAEMDWKRFMPARLTMYHDRKDGTHARVFTLTQEGSEAVLRTEDLASMSEEIAKIVGKERRIPIEQLDGAAWKKRKSDEITRFLKSEGK